MGTVGVKELKNRLPYYLRQTKRGEEIVITDRGTPVALLHPIDGGAKAMSLEGKLASLAARGAVILPSQKSLPRIRRVKVRGKSMSKTILEERR